MTTPGGEDGEMQSARLQLQSTDDLQKTMQETLKQRVSFNQIRSEIPQVRLRRVVAIYISLSRLKWAAPFFDMSFLWQTCSPLDTVVHE